MSLLHFNSIVLIIEVIGRCAAGWADCSREPAETGSHPGPPLKRLNSYQTRLDPLTAKMSCLEQQPGKCSLGKSRP